MLYQHCHVVPEIEKRLAWARVSQCARAEVIHYARAGVENFPTRPLNLPAQVDLFHVCEEVFIQAPVLPVCLSTDSHACAGRPKDFALVVVLTMIVLYPIKDASTAERISEPINVSTSCSGVFKFFRLIE